MRVIILNINMQIRTWNFITINGILSPKSKPSSPLTCPSHNVRLMKRQSFMVFPHSIFRFSFFVFVTSESFRLVIKTFGRCGALQQPSHEHTWKSAISFSLSHTYFFIISAQFISLLFSKEFIHGFIYGVVKPNSCATIFSFFEFTLRAKENRSGNI